MDQTKWIEAGVRVLLKNAIARKIGGDIIYSGLTTLDMVGMARIADADVEMESDRWCMRAEAAPGISDGVRDLMLEQAKAVLEVYRADGRAL